MNTSLISGVIIDKSRDPTDQATATVHNIDQNSELRNTNDFEKTQFENFQQDDNFDDDGTVLIRVDETITENSNTIESNKQERSAIQSGSSQQIGTIYSCTCFTCLTLRPIGNFFSLSLSSKILYFSNTCYPEYS